MSGLIPFNKKNKSIFDSSISDFRNMLDDFFADTWMPGRSLMRDTFKIDVEETDKEYLVHAELPGIRKENIALDISDGKLTLSVSQEENTDEENKNYIHRERRSVSMSRSIYLADAKEDGIRAKLEDGILTITVSKQEKPNNSTKIEIE